MKINQLKSVKPKNERAEIKKWCKLVRGVKAERRKKKGVNITSGIV
jgi:hypothetical protein